MQRHGDDSRIDFIDGVVFGPDTLVLNVGRFVEQAPWLSDYGFERIYYRSLLEREDDYLRTKDYLWRWDTDCFWCSRNFGLQRAWLRRLLGRERLNSRTYTRLMRWNARWGLTRRVDIPVSQAAAFLHCLLRETGIVPVWICPLRDPHGDDAHTLYPLQPRTFYVNFGFWDVVHSPQVRPEGHVNRLIEREVARLGGIKSLYSDSYFTREEFAAAYRMREYEALRRRYDPGHRLLDLYDKCVLRA